MRMAAVGVVVACLLLCAMPNYAGFLAITLCISILVTIRDNISVILGERHACVCVNKKKDPLNFFFFRSFLKNRQTSERKLNFA